SPPLPHPLRAAGSAGRAVRRAAAAGREPERSAALPRPRHCCGAREPRHVDPARALRCPHRPPPAAGVCAARARRARFRRATRVPPRAADPFGPEPQGGSPVNPVVELAWREDDPRAIAPGDFRRYERYLSEILAALGMDVSTPGT